MSTNPDFDRSLSAWLAEGPAELADRVLDAALEEVHTTRQRPRAARPRRTSPMTSIRTWAAAAGVVVAVGLVGLLLLQRTGGVAVPGPSAAPSAAGLVTTPSSAVTASSAPGLSPVPSPAASGISTADWTTFTSARYGYSLRVPPGWSQVQTSGRWKLARTDEQPKPADHLLGTSPLDGSPGEEFSAFAADIPAGTSTDAWIAAFFAPEPKPGHTPCLDQQSNYGSVEVQGHQASLWTESHISTACGGTYAFVSVGHRLYAFELGGTGQEALLLALLTTVKLPG